MLFTNTSRTSWLHFYRQQSNHLLKRKLSAWNKFWLKQTHTSNWPLSVSWAASQGSSGTERSQAQAAAGSLGGGSNTLSIWLWYTCQENSLQTPKTIPMTLLCLEIPLLEYSRFILFVLRTPLAQAAKAGRLTAAITMLGAKTWEAQAQAGCKWVRLHWFSMSLEMLAWLMRDDKNREPPFYLIKTLNREPFYLIKTLIVARKSNTT